MPAVPRTHKISWETGEQSLGLSNKAISLWDGTKSDDRPADSRAGHGGHCLEGGVRLNERSQSGHAQHHVGSTKVTASWVSDIRKKATELKLKKKWTHLSRVCTSCGAQNRFAFVKMFLFFNLRIEFIVPHKVKHLNGVKFMYFVEK